MKAILLLTLFTLASCERHKHVDPFKALDQHISQAFSYHYLWPWNQLMKAAALLEDDSFSEPQIVSDPEKMEINMNVKRFKPEELKVRVKNRNIIVEGKHDMDNNNKFMANHFLQRFVLPAGSKQEEVSAVLKDNGVLSISVPRHEVPPPPPEREVPIVVIKPMTTEKPEELPEKKSEKPPKKATEFTKNPSEQSTKETVSTEQEKNGQSSPSTPIKPPQEINESSSSIPLEQKKPTDTSSETPLEQFEIVEATTHVGKIRKKELKQTKTAKDNEVAKGLENNGLDYALIDNE